MLRKNLSARASRLCKLYARSIRQKSNIPETSIFPDKDVSTVKEQTLFNEVFTQMIKKEESKSNSSDKSGTNITSTGRIPYDPNDIQVVFEKKNGADKQDKFVQMMESLNASRRKLVDLGESARMTTEDIRNYPVSLTPAYFTEVADEAPPHGETGVDPLQGASGLKKSRSGFTSSNKAMDKENLAVLLEQALEPHFNYLRESIKTDKDLMDQLNTYFHSFATRDMQLEKQATSAIKDINFRAVQCPSVLPQPYCFTLPAIIRMLFTYPEFGFSYYRQYILLSMVYHTCKSSKDVNLYLQVCNIDFYNLLLQYTWRNFHDIHMIKSLIAEMSVNGIMGNAVTVEILQVILEKMNYMTDSIIDERGSPSELYSIGILWCKDTSNDVNSVDKYLRKLEESMQC